MYTVMFKYAQQGTWVSNILLKSKIWKFDLGTLINVHDLLHCISCITLMLIPIHVLISTDFTKAYFVH